jgi:hypothetical protein
MKTKAIYFVFGFLLLAGIQSKADTYGNFFFTDKGSSIEISGCITQPSGDLVIPSTINGKPVTSIAGAAFFNCSKLTSIPQSRNRF